MKKTFIALTIMFVALFAHAQQTVIVQRPGILTDLANAAGALVTIPAALAEGIVVGTAEAAGSLIHGSTEVYVVPQTPVVTTPVVTTPVVTTVPGYPTPIVTTPPTVISRPVVVAPPLREYTTITTYSPSGVVSVTRPVSAYESGTRISIPVPVEYRVGPSPNVNPYVRRRR